MAKQIFPKHNHVSDNNNNGNNNNNNKRDRSYSLRRLEHLFAQDTNCMHASLQHTTVAWVHAKNSDGDTIVQLNQIVYESEEPANSFPFHFKRKRRREN